MEDRWIGWPVRPALPAPLFSLSRAAMSVPPSYGYTVPRRRRALSMGYTALLSFDYRILKKNQKWHDHVSNKSIIIT
jgi:hypothetical protein